jgi:hypothetical protein
MAGVRMREEKVGNKLYGGMVLKKMKFYIHQSILLKILKTWFGEYLPLK